ncbi:HAMP domain-containing protein [Demequina sp. SYSU T00192]|uniref:histidine kinase n=1 Tax=Demequina litoralis TaxID=3051660 RepID=A0ABT8GA41_9MICO|nr:ATP-binding protein [Demequina sp. SYSU T00192]MDN4476005.1 HAMP domain-containing protein [Demequina sp. SYSU T00192]
MLQRLGIRGKLLAVVMVPVLVLVSAVSYITLSAVNDYSENSNAERLIDALGQARETEADLQDERTAALRFVHILQDTTTKLGAAREEVAARYATLADAVARSEDDDADAVLASVDAALGGSDASMLADARSLEISAPESEGGWLVMPSTDEIATMDAAYADAVEAVDATADAAPGSLDLGIPLAALSYAIEQEGAYAHSLYSDSLEYRDALDATFPKVDAGLDDIAAAAAEVDATDENAAALASVAAGSQLRDSLPQIRAGVRTAQVSTSTILNYYTEVIDTFVGATDAVALAVPDRNIVATLQAYAALDMLVERVRYEGDVFERLIRQGSFVTAEIAGTRTLVERTKIALDEAQARGAGLVPPIEVPDFGASASTTGTSFTTIQNSVLTGLDSSLVTARSADWPGKVELELEQYLPLRDQAWDRTTSAITANTRNALGATYITLAIGIGAVIGSLLIAFAISRRIVNPLRRLTTTATAVREELPRLVERVAQPGEDVDVSEVQISVESQDEVGRLAEAFNGVNAATIEIAREQAALRGSISEMFVNVARRDQVLLNRQLSSIDEMERTEDDPDRLTRLFALDHLATRMRRNSESLLVLAGIDTGRRLRRPMPLSDVIRTASSEIELYERVDLDLVVDPAMHGHQALTAAHLFAELLENATVFSDPGSRVIVRTGRTEAGFTVEVVDTGIGMTVPELAEANSRVQSSAASEILGAQRLGLFVVGRIARRLDAQVAVSSVEGRGTVATVLLPSSLFEAVEEPVQAPVVEEPRAEAPQVEAYAPTTVVEGASLSGRAADEPVEDDDSIPLPVGIEALIAADAAAAPVAEAIAPDLTSGTTTGGLPTRRRRAEEPAAEAAEKPEERTQVIGLPVRATADQLDALDAEAAAFTPTVAAAEVAPQTPEERASMFRGFHSRRDAQEGTPAEPLPEAVPPVMADALGEPVEAAEEQAPALPTRAAGGAFAAFDAIRRASETMNRDDAPAEQPAEEPAVIEPVALAPDEDEAAAAAPQDDAPVAHEEAAPEPVEEPAVPALPTFSMPKLATAEIPVVTAERLTPASPFARSPYGAAFAAPAPETTAEPVAEPAPALEAEPEALPEVALEPETAPDAEAPLAIPGLEPEDGGADEVPALEEDAPALPWASVTQVDLPEPAESPWTPPAPWASAAEPALEPDAEPVVPEPVAAQAEPEPQVDQPAPWMDAAAFAAAAAAHESALEPAPYAPQDEQDAGVSDVALEDPYTAPEAAHPSLDDIIAQASGEESGRSGFFGRLFGRGKRDDDTAPQAALPARAPFAPAAPVPAEPEPAPAAFAPAAPQDEPAAFAPAEPEPVVEEPVAAPATPTSFEPAAFEPGEQEARAEVEWSYAPPVPAAPAPTPELAPEPEPAPEPAPEPVRAQSFEPEPADASYADMPESQLFRPEPQQFTPEDLAEAHGWESAGASALAAATDETAATSYEPVLDTEHSSGRTWDDDADLQRAVFSELSSLSASRPKVEKTKAGLQKRRRTEEQPVEAQPLEDEVTLSPKERDAEAVRSRFSSFYSGTQRARTDAAELDLHSSPQPVNE